jgi:hypothetical protein
MESRAIRSRTVELSQEDIEPPAGESECDKPSEQPEKLGSVGKQCELTITPQQGIVSGPESGALPAGPVEVSNKDSKEKPSQDTSYLKQILTGIMEVNRADLGAHNEKIQILQESGKPRLSSVKAGLSSLISQLQEANIKFQEILRAQTKT